MRIVVFFIICFIIASCSKIIHISYDVYYVPKNIHTIISLSEQEIIQDWNHNFGTLKRDDFEKISRYINNKKEINEILSYSKFNFVIDDFDNEKNDDFDVESIVEEIDDYILDIRYVLLFKDNSSETKISIGSRRQVIKVNEKYYEISEKDFDELVHLIERLIKP